MTAINMKTAEFKNVSENIAYYERKISLSKEEKFAYKLMKIWLNEEIKRNIRNIN